MPVRLPGVARAIQQIGPTRWTPNQIDVMKEAERIRKRQEAGQPIDPREIAAWAQLAQIIMKDDTLVGGLVNMLSRKSRESAAKKRTEDRAAAKKGAEEAAAAKAARERGDWPYGVPNLQQELAAEVPEYPRIQELQARSMASRDPEEKTRIANEIMQLRQGLGSRGIVAPPPVPLRQPPAVEEQITETVTEAPAPTAPAPSAPRTREQMYQQVLKEEAEQRKLEVANIEKVVRERNLTVSDLYGMAATAKSPEVVRTLMAMVPKVVEQDPAYAPRYLSELLFGWTDKTQQISKELITLWGQSQRARRGDDYSRKVERYAKSESRLAALESKIAGQEAAAKLKRTKAADIDKMRPSEIDLNVARAEALRAKAGWWKAKSDKEKKRLLRGVGKMRGSKGLTDPQKATVAAYAEWLDAVNAGKKLTNNPYSEYGKDQMATVGQLVRAEVVTPFINTKRKHADLSALVKNIEARAKGAAKGATPEDKAASRDWKALTHYRGLRNTALASARAAAKAFNQLSLMDKEAKGGKLQEDEKTANKAAKRYLDLINTIERRLGIAETTRGGGGGGGATGGDTPPASQPQTGRSRLGL